MQSNIIHLAEWHITEPAIMGTDQYLSNSNSPDLAEDIRLCIYSGTRDMVLECGKLDYLTGAGMRMILSIAHMMWAQNGKFSLRGLRGQPLEMFHACGYGNMIVSDDEAQIRISAAA